MTDRDSDHTATPEEASSGTMMRDEEWPSSVFSRPCQLMDPFPPTDREGVVAGWSEPQCVALGQSRGVRLRCRAVHDLPFEIDDQMPMQGSGS